MSEFSLVRNQKNGKIALHGGYEYNLNKKSKDDIKTYWRCTQ